MPMEHCAIEGVTVNVEKLPFEFRSSLPYENRCFLLAEHMGTQPIPPRSAWSNWIEAANSLGAEGWELVQVSDRQVWQGIEAWGLPAPPSTTYYPGKLLVLKRVLDRS